VSALDYPPPTHRKLLDNVLADPADDEPRMVCADYFSEREDARGEFIILQCRIARVLATDPNADDARLTAMQAREHSILVEHGARWLADVGLLPGEGVFERGFVEVVKIAYERLIRADDRFGSREPATRLALRQLKEADVEDVLARPWTQRLTSFSLHNNGLGPAAVQAMLRAPRPPKLARLNLWGNRIGDAGVTALASSTYLAGITHLDLGATRLTNDGIIALAGCPHLVSLEQLELENNRGIDDAAFHALATSPYLKHLKRLNLPEGAARLRKHFPDVIR
jgi:uncharacterized protein (TIGR02996 family)